ncbi:UTP--glucose-1-phosphate uridylyltransferase GalU [Saccharibacillus sp. CPCC 101409]|uniref:UTP--glucose-1-phosphate uridylyltransferase GalU n=1 Tax=Saccharibacillus sp. CPCC 101409 TaxID=3058041 RepID=UPI0026717FD6|nr:UTP--glucose-1-phosphate uridylyltransferase GalU [Saccharibacillus sp. CPCC 101409]MDO3411679.1 UTP--glucose-1-phosphate uridylyltransferase GalU [Saccharibacillus sp. CPCC 101409]
MSTVKKAIIPAAGLGTRFLPATKAMPKEMLPIVDKPTIQYIVEEAISSGIEDIIIVTGRSKRAIEDHFDKNIELEADLEEKNKEELLSIVREVTNLVEIHCVRQKEPLGLGHAIWCARKFINNEPFAVLLGDMIIDSEVPCLKQMMDEQARTGGNMIAVEAVPWKDVSSYGVIKGDKLTDNLNLITDLVEKPKVDPPSNLAMIGRYILEPEIMNILEHQTAGVGGEIQLTDALKQLAQLSQMYSFRYDGTLYDVGSKLGYLKANVDFALKREDLGSDLRDYLIESLIGDPAAAEKKDNLKIV